MGAEREQKPEIIIVIRSGMLNQVVSTRKYGMRFRLIDIDHERPTSIDMTAYGGFSLEEYTDGLMRHNGEEEAT